MQTLTTSKEELMPQTFDPTEKWTVSTGKDHYTLNGSQAQLIKTASLSGQRGLIFFDGFAISIAHIVSMERVLSKKDMIGKEEKEARYKKMREILILHDTLNTR